MASKEYESEHVRAYCSEFDPLSPVCQNCDCRYVDIEEAIIYQECHAFYAVFLQLEEQLKISGVHDEPTVKLPTLLSVPYYVNGAFACELALKYLLISSNVPFNMRKGHNLAYLFRLLPQQEKEIISALIKNDCNLSDSAFQEGLDLIADIFNIKRYWFNYYNKNFTTHGLFNPFVHILCKFVFEEEYNFRPTTCEP